MIDSSDEIKNRYREVVTEIDDRGRAIVVGRLRISQTSDIQEMVASDAALTSYMVASAVRKIDDDHLAFPKTKAEVRSRMDTLDREGMKAASKAFATLYNLTPDASETVEQPQD